jgi:hypothetical protein
VVVLDLNGKLRHGDPAERLTDQLNSLLCQGNQRRVINLEYEPGGVGFTKGR